MIQVYKLTTIEAVDSAGSIYHAIRGIRGICGICGRNRLFTSAKYGDLEEETLSFSSFKDDKGDP